MLNLKNKWYAITGNYKKLPLDYYATPTFKSVLSIVNDPKTTIDKHGTANYIVSYIVSSTDNGVSNCVAKAIYIKIELDSLVVDFVLEGKSVTAELNTLELLHLQDILNTGRQEALRKERKESDQELIKLLKEATRTLEEK